MVATLEQRVLQSSFKPGTAVVIQKPGIDILPEFLDLLGVKEPIVTREKFHAYSIAKDISLDGKVSIIATAGGDGTINEVGNGVIDGLGTGRITLVIYRRGSGNDDARSLGIFSEEDSVEALRQGKSCYIDAIKATYTNFKGEPETRRAFNVAGVGFDSVISLEVQNCKSAGVFDYATSILKSLREYSAQPLSVKVDGVDLGEKKRYFVTLFNGRFGARGVPGAPTAFNNDGKNEVLIAGKVGKLEALFVMGLFYTKLHLHYPKISYQPARCVEISGNGLLQLDGEVVGKTPVKLECEPHALRVFYLERKAKAVLPS